MTSSGRRQRAQHPNSQLPPCTAGGGRARHAIHRRRCRCRHARRHRAHPTAAAASPGVVTPRQVQGTTNANRTAAAAGAMARGRGAGREWRVGRQWPLMGWHDKTRGDVARQASALSTLLFTPTRLLLNTTSVLQHTSLPPPYCRRGPLAPPPACTPSVAEDPRCSRVPHPLDPQKTSPCPILHKSTWFSRRRPPPPSRSASPTPAPARTGP
jgi:hypothetical protein